MQRRATSHQHDDEQVLAVPSGDAASSSSLPTQTKRRRRRVRQSGFATHYYGQKRRRLLRLEAAIACVVAIVFGAYLIWLWMVSSPPSHHYRIPESTAENGDKSPEYAELRYNYDMEHPSDPIRTRMFVQSLRKNTYRPVSIPTGANYTSYDVFNCPDEPPQNYPYQWNIVDDIISNWPPDDPKPRSQVYQGLCVFDYLIDYEKALKYRAAELPFVVRNDPNVLQTVERWNTPDYLPSLMGNVNHRTEYSVNNHFMYWQPPEKDKKRKLNLGKRNRTKIKAPSDWTAPTKQMRMKYSEWIKHANVSDDKLGPDKEHWYYRLIGCGGKGTCDEGSSEYLFDELPFFQPKPSLYMVDPNRQKGIHCRFGMKGVIAENHFDGSRNFIVLLGGERRYILTHPNQCENLALFPKGHPSARHSAVDWSNPDLESYPTFQKARGNEVVMQAGDVMYLPTNWFHYIISLDLNFQCNTRSGVSQEYMQAIHHCGF